VRFHGEVVRIEIVREEMARGCRWRWRFKYVTLHLVGYRQGALNEVLNLVQS
jgi:PP-loop superfamily ATP-utilizing enzyme